MKVEYVIQSRAKKTSFAVFVLALLLGGCKIQQSPATDYKPEIEKAVRAYVPTWDNKFVIKGLSYQRIQEDLYLVGVVFDQPDDAAMNFVARRFEEDGKSYWKIEPMNDRWKQIIRIEPEK